MEKKLKSYWKYNLQTCLWWWWQINKNKNKNIYRQYDYKFSKQKLPKEKAPCKCLSIVMVDSVIKAKKKYYPQTLLEEYKYEQGRIKIENLIDDDLEKNESEESGSETESDTDNVEYDE